MTTENQNKPAFYIFVQDDKGENKRIGAAFRHKKGNGLNILIDGKRYSAFPPKASEATGEAGA